MTTAAQNPRLSVPTKLPSTHPIARWLRHGQRLDEHSAAHQGHAWYRVLWLTGVDYFSTLGYQPGIALLAAGAVSPIATLWLVAMTLFGAVPVYAAVAKRSFAGQGSIAMLEDAFAGWRGKLVVLALLGFAATSFIITITLSAADAAEHMVHNPFLRPALAGREMLVTLLLIALLAVVFLRGFHDAISVAIAVGIPYIVLNLIVLGRGLIEIASRPELLDGWQDALNARGDPTTVVIMSALVFPKLALGMSGFETGVSVMPQVAGAREDAASGYPAARVRNTRKLLIAAALIMSLLLVMSSFVTSLLLSEEDYREGGPAAGRAIAFIAHRTMGTTFGSIYDFSTIAILWFAGASAMVGMLNLFPRYLPRFGMAPQWIAYQRPLVLVLFLVCALVTWAFDADVEAQGSSYATGVLVLMLSASVAVAIDTIKEVRVIRDHAPKLRKLALAIYFWFIALVFAYTLGDNIVERSDGVVIACFFIGAILGAGALSRAWRSTELRVSELTFVDPATEALWKEMGQRKVHAVPLRTGSSGARHRKALEIRRFYKTEGSFAFLHVNLVDNRSDFLAPLQAKVSKEGEDYVVEVFGAVAIANTIAYVSELIDPRSIFLGLTREGLMGQSINYLLWGEGEIALMVYMILIRYWHARTGEEHVRPNIFIMST